MPMSFESLFERQIKNQQALIDEGKYEDFSSKNLENVCLPIDDPRLMSYHTQQLISEIGEVLEADKRWKTHRNAEYDRAGKLEELADCFIVLMNMAIFSGMSAKEVAEAIDKKLIVVMNRISG